MALRLLRARPTAMWAASPCRAWPRQAIMASSLGNVVLPGVAFSIVLWTIIPRSATFAVACALALQMKGLTVLALFRHIYAVWSQDSLRSFLFGVILFYSDTIWILSGPKIRLRRVGDPHRDNWIFSFWPESRHWCFDLPRVMV